MGPKYEEERQINWYETKVCYLRDSKQKTPSKMDEP